MHLQHACVFRYLTWSCMTPFLRRQPLPKPTAVFATKLRFLNGVVTAGSEGSSEAAAAAPPSSPSAAATAAATARLPRPFSFPSRGHEQGNVWAPAAAAAAATSGDRCRRLPPQLLGTVAGIVPRQLSSRCRPSRPRRGRAGGRGGRSGGEGGGVSRQQPPPASAPREDVRVRPQVFCRRGRRRR